MPKRSSRSRRIWQAALLLIPALAIGLWLPGHISITLTPSLGYRIFLLVDFEDLNFKQGDYLLFHKQLADAGIDKLLKMVGCASGDQLTVEGDEYFCGDNYLGHALKHDSKGRELPRFIFNGTVPAGNLFMIGSHPRSYDSKYFGFIHAKNAITANDGWHSFC